MIDWLFNQPVDGMKNYTWVFSGIGVPLIVFAATRLFKKNHKKELSSITTTSATNNNTPSIYNSNTVNINTGDLDSTRSVNKGNQTSTPRVQDMKHLTNILFIDDDIKFKVSKILIKNGWANTKIIKDVTAVDCVEVKSANILFIDIQGVGILLGFSNEGLGLAQAIKNRWPDKKVIIYSAETQGDRFDKALRQADDFLPKNAEPYEFISLVEDYANQLFGCEK